MYLLIRASFLNVAWTNGSQSYLCQGPPICYVFVLGTTISNYFVPGTPIQDLCCLNIIFQIFQIDFQDFFHFLSLLLGLVFVDLTACFFLTKPGNRTGRERCLRLQDQSQGHCHLRIQPKHYFSHIIIENDIQQLTTLTVYVQRFYFFGN